MVSLTMETPDKGKEAKFEESRKNLSSPITTLKEFCRTKEKDLKLASLLYATRTSRVSVQDEERRLNLAANPSEQAEIFSERRRDEEKQHAEKLSQERGRDEEKRDEEETKKM